MRLRNLLIIAVVSVLAFPMRLPAPSGNYQPSQTGIPGTAAPRGISNEEWIAVRTDGNAGTGTAEDPFDGSTQAKFEALLAGAAVGSHIHLQGGTFFAQGRNPGISSNVVSNCWIQGSGRDVSIIQITGSAAGGAQIEALTGNVNNVQISDLTIDCNWAAVGLTATNGATVRTVANGVTTTSSATVTSATLALTSNDIGRVVTGSTDFPANTFIGTVTNATTFSLSSSPTSNVPVLVTTGHTGQTITLVQKNCKVSGIWLFGSNNSVRNVRVTNGYGSSSDNQEAFHILMSPPGAGPNATGLSISGCVIDTPWGNYSSPYAFGGTASFITNGARVDNCFAFGNNNGLDSGFETGGVNLSYTQDVEISNCHWQDCCAAYHDTGTLDGLTVLDNTVIRGIFGVNMNGSGTQQNINVRSCVFRIQNRGASGAVGHFLAGSAACTNVILSDNTFSVLAGGLGGSTIYPIFAGTNLASSYIVNNIIDSGYTPNVTGGTVRQIGNRTPGGAIVPGLVDNVLASSAATGRVTAQSAANASIATFTVGSVDGSFEVSMNMNVTVATGISTSLVCVYTDESNTLRTLLFPVTSLSGSFLAGGLVVATGAYETPVLHIRCKASTSITLKTAAGTFTGVTYTAEGIIKQTQ